VPKEVILSLSDSFAQTVWFSQSIEYLKDTIMNLKALSAVSIGATLVALAASAANAAPMPADQFHWSSAIDSTGKVLYNGKAYMVTSEKVGQADSFIKGCNSEIRVRGFLTGNMKEDWSKAEYLCGQLSVGGTQVSTYNQAGEIKVFGPIYNNAKNSVLNECRAYSGSGNRVWSNCGAIVPNDRTSSVFVGDGKNAGRVMQTANLGSGIETVHPVLFPETETMRDKIFRERVEAGYYSNK
jgi:hypothetical protein